MAGGGRDAFRTSKILMLPQVFFQTLFDLLISFDMKVLFLHFMRYNREEGTEEKAPIYNRDIFTGEEKFQIDLDFGGGKVNYRLVGFIVHEGERMDDGHFAFYSVNPETLNTWRCSDSEQPKKINKDQLIFAHSQAYVSAWEKTRTDKQLLPALKEKPIVTRPLPLTPMPLPVPVLALKMLPTTTTTTTTSSSTSAPVTNSGARRFKFTRKPKEFPTAAEPPLTTETTTSTTAATTATTTATPTSKATASSTKRPLYTSSPSTAQTSRLFKIL